ncbi:MAG: DUF5916 domain-containing protein, partial [Bacteroidota bacterium]
DEAAWQSARLVSGFTQREPVQGNAASYDTEVRILFDEEFLYVGAFCYDSLPNQRRLRVRHLQRDFAPYGNDRFGVAIDGLLDQRNAVGFEVTPYGSQREVQVIDGEEFDGNDNWDALWFVRTSITKTGWVAEMAIPWKTLRYRADSREMLISFNRNIRRNNEITTWPAYPRIFSHFRMAYAARLTGIKPPPPGANLQVNPYVLGSQRREANGTATDENDQNFKIGGELKWAMTPNSVLDVTVNTDFAQADVDQQVQNLTRFSVLFPERRQFFLENASIFRAGTTDLIQPFFSRQIGLDAAGRPLPLNGGLRFTNQTTKQTAGLLTMRQRPTDTSPGATFGVGRYARNFSDQSRLGGLITYRRDDAFSQAGSVAQNNTTATLDGLFRPVQSISVEGMVSASNDDAAGSGLAGQLRAYHQRNWGFFQLQGRYVSPNYLPRTGFVAFADFLNAQTVVDFDFRPQWLPSFVRSFGPDAVYQTFWRASDGKFQQTLFNFSPLDLEWQTGGQFEIRFNHERQQIDGIFRPLGIAIAPGSYSFTRTAIEFESDFSQRYAAYTRLETGKYYDGNLLSWEGGVSISPSPYVDLFTRYTYNRIRGVGIEDEDLDAQLLFFRARLALNPRLRLNGSYQWNSVGAAEVWNVRLVWEYRPLSFVYLVFNRNGRDGAQGLDRNFNEEFIGKVTYLRQF